jgi:hypothetical protein
MMLRCRGSNPVDQLDGRTRIGNAKTVTRQRPLVNPRVKVGETVGELDLGAIHIDRSESGAGTVRLDQGEVGGDRGEKPANACSREMDYPAVTASFGDMNLEAIDRAEQPKNEVKQVDADVRRYATRFFERGFPRNIVPRPA